jgi:hypothetical protein
MASDKMLSWLRSTIQGDKAAAEATEDSSAPWDGQWIADGNKALRTYNQHVLAHVGGWEFKPGVLDHLARHDPRDTIARSTAELALLDRLEYAMNDPINFAFAARNLAEDAIEALTSGYSHREGFNPDWVSG